MLPLVFTIRIFPILPVLSPAAEQPKKEWMEGYFFGKPYIFDTYYQKAAELFPDIDAAHYLLGFCEYYLGNFDMPVRNMKNP